MSDVFQFDNGDLKITCFRDYFISGLHCQVEYLLSWSKIIKEILPMNILATESDKEVM